MMKRFLFSACVLATMTAGARTIVETSAYTWHGDTITQGEFMATAVSPEEIVSSYSAQPGFFMPVEKRWSLKNDISAYPGLKSSNMLHEAAYNMALDEMVNAVEPDTTLRTGKEWAGVWTRDVSYSILLSMAYMQPEASMVSLLKKIDPQGRIVQDTGSGGAWPVSTDREIWVVAAYEIYKVTGDRNWLATVYPVALRSLTDDRASGLYDNETGLVKGETSFIDWREQSHPKWMQTADIYNTETLSTSIVHARAWKDLSEMARILGHKKVAEEAMARSREITDAVNRHLWLDDKGYYAMYRYGRDNLITNPRAETLGESLAVVWDVADDARKRSIVENNPTTPFGSAIFYPQISDMPAYHNNSLWPWVGAWWAIANARMANEDGTMQGIGAIIRPAALFCTNKENFNLDNGDIATELNSSNMLWCLSGNIALTHKILFGMEFESDGLAFRPFVPEALAGDLRLDNFRYRGAVLNISVKGYGAGIKSFSVNGKEQKPFITPGQAKGTLDIDIVMDDIPVAPMRVNNVANAESPVTPIAAAIDGELTWQPIEYIDHYIVVRDGERIADVTTTTFPMDVPGEYQVIGVAGNGIESFASQPVSNRPSVRFDFPGETTVMESSEIGYAPVRKISGYRGEGFVETDHARGRVSVPVEVDEEGVYFISFRYANGNGPVNTENRCGTRTLFVDDVEQGLVVMPQRGVGNWSDWGMTNSVPVRLTPGRHMVALELLPHQENMNLRTNHSLLDQVILTKD